MGSFDQGIAGMASLRSVNEWIGVINSNLGGSNRTAYKATRVSFGGGVSNVVRDPRQSVSGIQIPDSTLNIDHTRIDFSQGTIIQDGELTHLAINGNAFFAFTTNNDTTISITSPTLFFTRDGEFKWTSIGTNMVLTTAAGFTVLSETGAAIIRTTGTTGATFSVTIDGTESTTTGAAIGLFQFNNNQALKFSKYGSTVFDASQAQAPTTITAALARQRNIDIVQGGLESSNASLNDTLPELSLAQKMFSAVSKIINVHNSNLDVVVNLIR